MAFKRQMDRIERDKYIKKGRINRWMDERNNKCLNEGINE